MYKNNLKLGKKNGVLIVKKAGCMSCQDEKHKTCLCHILGGKKGGKIPKEEIQKAKLKDEKKRASVSWIQDNADKQYLEQFDEEAQKIKEKQKKLSQKIQTDPKYREAYMRQTKKREQKEYDEKIIKDKEDRAMKEAIIAEEERKRAEKNKDLFDKITEKAIDLTKKIPLVGDVVNLATSKVYDKLKDLRDIRQPQFTVEDFKDEPDYMGNGKKKLSQKQLEYQQALNIIKNKFKLNHKQAMMKYKEIHNKIK